jgi:hypothetical protein
VKSLVVNPQAATTLGRAAAQRVGQFTIERLVQCFETAIAPEDLPAAGH